MFWASSKKNMERINMLHFHKTKVEESIFFFKVTTERWRVISAWSPVKFEFHSRTRFTHYVSYFINWLWRKCLQRAPVPTAENCKTAGCTSFQGHKPARFPESWGKTSTFMKITSQYFLIPLCVQCTVRQTRWQRGYFTVAQCSVGNKDGRGCRIGSASSFLFEPCFRKLAMFITSPV